MTAIDDVTEARLGRRPRAAKLVVPYVVDADRRPVDFKALDDAVGGAVRGPLAFVGPDDGRRCFADPWMHEGCARVALEQCPFLAGRRDWREDGGPLLDTYSAGMVLFVAPDGRSHRGPLMEWHFEVVGELRKVPAGLIRSSDGKVLPAPVVCPEAC